MESSIFAVNDEPYCLWETNIQERNRAFLNGIDSEYFTYVLDTHLEAEDEKRALVAIRLSLHHATETMFSLLGAFVQGPDCAYAWIAKCNSTELREFVKRLNQEDQTLITKLPIKRMNWKSVADIIFATYQPETERQTHIKNSFSNFWERLAGEFSDAEQVDEYNALKHGFRMRSGGFTLAVGAEEKYGIAPPESKMNVIGQSAFGSTFFKIEKLRLDKSDRNIRSRQTSVNWSLERVILLHQLVNMSINNTVSALKIVSGVASASSCKFICPESGADFDLPWAHSTGVTSMKMDYVIDESRVPHASKSELLAKLRA